MENSQKRIVAKLFGTATAAALLFTLSTSCRNEGNDIISDDSSTVSEPIRTENISATEKTKQAAAERKDISDIAPDSSAPMAVPVLSKEEADALVEKMNREK